MAKKSKSWGGKRRGSGRKRRKTRAVVARAPEHPIFAMAREEPELRKRRFILALWHTIPHMNGDDIALIGPVLERIIGREFIEKLEIDIGAVL